MEKVIYLAGGCFWGVEGYFKRLKGVIDTTVGYANGNIKNPTYTQVKTHIATHAETVKITKIMRYRMEKHFAHCHYLQTL